MINFSQLVLNPCLNAFAQPCMLTPVISQPSAPAYPCRGVWSNKPVEITLEGDNLHSTNQPILGIRVVEFPVPPRALDLISTAGVTYQITNPVFDGQGGADLWLKIYDPTDTGEIEDYDDDEYE